MLCTRVQGGTTLTQEQPNEPASQTGALSGTVAELDTFDEGSTPVPLPNPTRQRLSVCTCYVCHEQLGAGTTERIGNQCARLLYTHIIESLVCGIKDCFRGSAHLACLNLMVPRYQLALVRCWYFCPAHRAQKWKQKVDRQKAKDHFLMQAVYSSAVYSA